MGQDLASVLHSPFTSSISGDLTKFGRGDASSPAPATTLAQPQQSQTQTHHTTQQTFLNPALPPGYSYTSLPYYTGVPGLPSTFQYGPAVFPVSFPEARSGIWAEWWHSKASPHSVPLCSVGCSYLFQAAWCECQRQCISNPFPAAQWLWLSWVQYW